jgi:hypothetical protein
LRGGGGYTPLADRGEETAAALEASLDALERQMDAILEAHEAQGGDAAVAAAADAAAGKKSEADESGRSNAAGK